MKTKKKPYPAMEDSSLNSEVRRTTFRERYATLLEHLRTSIDSGVWKPGQYIPAENELARTFQLSRPSVRKALAELAGEGLVRTMHGKGTVVSERRASTVLHLFWGMPSFEFEAIRHLVRRFNESQQRIRVELIPMPLDELTAATLEGTFKGRIQPDLIGMSNSLFCSVADRGPGKLLQPLKLKDAADCYEPYIRAFSHQNKMWAAPIIFAPIVMAYNKTMFERKRLPVPCDGWTWQQLLEAARALTEYDSGGQVARYGFSFSASLNRWPLFVLQNGGTFADADGNVSDDRYTREALQFTRDLMYEHRVTPIFSAGSGRVGEELFLRQKVGMILTSYSFLAQFRDIEFEWDLVRFPGRVSDTGLGIATGIGISARCERTFEAETFIDYALSTAAQSDLKRLACTVPVRRSVAESRAIPHGSSAGERYYLFERLAPHTRTMKDFGLKYEQLVDLNTELGLLWANVETVEEALYALRAKWQKARA